MTEPGNGKLARCGYCGALVIWRKHERTHGATPLDHEPLQDGNIVLVAATFYRVLRKGETPDPSTPRFVNHHMTCPNLPRGRERKS